MLVVLTNLIKITSRLCPQSVSVLKLENSMGLSASEGFSTAHVFIFDHFYNISVPKHTIVPRCALILRLIQSKVSNGCK